MELKYETGDGDEKTTTYLLIEPYGIEIWENDLLSVGIDPLLIEPYGIEIGDEVAVVLAARDF